MPEQSELDGSVKRLHQSKQNESVCEFLGVGLRVFCGQEKLCCKMLKFKGTNSFRATVGG